MDSNQYNGQSQVQDKRQGENNTKGTELLHQTRGVSFVIRKTEKLTTALYMVTDIMSEKDPMKWKMREIGVDILSDITLSLNATASERMSVFHTVMRKVERLISFLDIAQSAQMMSEMNSSVLRKEYLTLRNAIENEWHNVYDDGKRILSGAFSEDKDQKPQGAPQKENIPENSLVVEKEEIKKEEPSRPAQSLQENEQTNSIVQPKEDLKTKESMPAQKFSVTQMHPERLVSSPIVPIARNTERKQYENTHTNSGTFATESGFGRARSEGDRDDRRKIILALIKQKPALTVKDIIKSIPQVSEKTIQRELLAMVSEGLLIKKGERRWSTYSLREG